MRRLGVIATVALLLAVLPADGLAKSSRATFELGTYSGTLGGQPMKIRIRRATCDVKRQRAVEVKGFCMTVLKLKAPSATCSDGSTMEIDLPAYDSDHEEIHLANSGRYSDTIETFESGRKEPVLHAVLKFTAKGSRIKGTLASRAIADNGLPCTAGTQSFSLRR